MNESIMLSTVCFKCHNDFPAVYGDCPYCTIVADEQKRGSESGDDTQGVWGVAEDDYVDSRQTADFKWTYFLSPLFAAALASLFIVCSMRKPPDPLGNPEDWPYWAIMDEGSEEVHNQSNDSKETLREASSHHGRQQVTR